MKLYGIPNCNTVKKARVWLSEQGQTVEFHDFKKQGVSEALLKNWVKLAGWEKLVNRKGTTWRQLPDGIKNSIDNEAAAIQLMMEKSSVIKRPVLENNGKIAVGFDETIYQEMLSQPN
ncbi:ArsC family reductase [Sulfurirhabdus autotrophica]|uniref:Spx/MgsR family transcriptional regulator n=1 Tax=Sulfurirhabdus autotrophica TaxID=1706046 RepID=A0A4R3YDP5_9PROT|nr:ArsC family reductase [Sulfurirhabdus autotrophica]TCV90140.1 Spx/MgsR family transcriptional regulator [Sulfurirhabdus autotrophica]